MKLVSDASTLDELRRDIIKLARHQAGVYLSTPAKGRGMSKTYRDMACAMNDFADTLSNMEICPK